MSNRKAGNLVGYSLIVLCLILIFSQLLPEPWLGKVFFNTLVLIVCVLLANILHVLFRVRRLYKLKRLRINRVKTS